jgi:hypothetical protein
MQSCPGTLKLSTTNFSSFVHNVVENYYNLPHHILFETSRVKNVSTNEFETYYCANIVWYDCDKLGKLYTSQKNYTLEDFQTNLVRQSWDKQCPVCQSSSFIVPAKIVWSKSLHDWKMLQTQVSRCHIDCDLFVQLTLAMFMNQKRYRFAPTICKHKLIVFCAISNRKHYVQETLNAMDMSTWDCLIFAYGAVNLTLYTRLHCNIVWRVSESWGQFLDMLHPSTIKQYTHILLQLDDISWENFSADKLVNTMQDANLASPVIHGSQYRFMYKQSLRIPFIEIFTTIFTREAWTCFWKMIHTLNKILKKKSLGFGYDICLPAHCPQLKYFVDYTQEVKHHSARHKKLNLARTQTWLFKRWTRTHMNSECVDQHTFISKV